MSEYRLHVAVVKHINSAFIGTHNPNFKFWHTPNQTKDASEAFFNKQMGVMVGVPDLMFGWPRRNVGVIELKTDKNQLSPPQTRFMSWASDVGWNHGVARTVKQVHDILLSWGLKAAHHSIIEPDHADKEQKQTRAFEFYASKETK